MRFSFKGFMAFFIVLVFAISYLLVTFNLLGAIPQVIFEIAKFLMAIPISLVMSAIGERIIKRANIKFTEAKPEELLREDDVLLQAVAFSQAVLLFFINLILPEENSKIILSVFIVVFAVTFYVMRAWAKISGNSKWRYNSMFVLAFLLAGTVFSLLISPIQFFFPELYETFSLVFGMVSISVSLILMELGTTMFKKRYGIT